jgi:glycosyltransferase involved in cell wall biosynthesis
MFKVSIVIPAHDEENNIAKAIANLYEFPYKNYEVIIGLDNCHDQTLPIVKQMCIAHPNFKYKVFEERQGKAQMINKIIDGLNTDIIIIQDVDWYMDINEWDLKYMLKLLENEYVHGIADSFPITYPLKKDAGILEIGNTLHGLVFIDAIKNKATKFVPGYKQVDENYFPPLVNIFKKKSFIPNKSLGDDFERAANIWKQNRAILMSDSLDPSRMKSSGEIYTLKGVWKQKKRTALARQQLNDLYPGLKMKIPKWDLIKSMWRNVISPCKIKYMWSFGVVTMLFLLGNIFKPKDISTKEGWNMRAR